MSNFTTSKSESLKYHQAVLENKKAHYKFEFQKLKTIVRELEEQPELHPSCQPFGSTWTNLVKIYTEMEMLENFIRELNIIL